MISLDLPWLKQCITSEIPITPVDVVNPNSNPPVPAIAAKQTAGATFQINNAKPYVPVSTLSINDNIKFLENMKQGFKRTISQNKYRSEITTQTKNKNLDYLIEILIEILIDCLYFRSKMVMMILEEIFVMSITCH